MAPLLQHAATWAREVLVVPLALAQGNTTGQGGNPTKLMLFNPLKNTTIIELLNTILQGLTLLAVPVVTIMVMIGAFYLITSGGNPARRTKGKDYIVWAAIGFAVLLLATSVTAIISTWLKP